MWSPGPGPELDPDLDCSNGHNIRTSLDTLPNCRKSRKANQSELVKEKKRRNQVAATNCGMKAAPATDQVPLTYEDGHARAWHQLIPDVARVAESQRRLAVVLKSRHASSNHLGSAINWRYFTEWGRTTRGTRRNLYTNYLQGTNK